MYTICMLFHRRFLCCDCSSHSQDSLSHLFSRNMLQYACCSSAGFCVVLVPPIIKILFNICSLLICYNMHVVLSLGFCVVLVLPIINIFFSFCSLPTCYNMHVVLSAWLLCSVPPTIVSPPIIKVFVTKP
jgi:hypothetical protein